MITVILFAFGLVAITVATHALGFAWLLGSLKTTYATPPTRFWPITLLLIRLAWCLILIHLTEIAVWGMFYFWKGCLPNAESSFYFAGVTYTTLGYGDLVLPVEWRMLGPVEALTGILMCGLSAGLFFAAISRIYAPQFGSKPK